METQRVASTGGIADTAGRTSETPVSIPPTITYGLQETHTTVLPQICWFSAPNLDYTYIPTTFKIRLNGIYAVMTGDIVDTAVTGKLWTRKATQPDVYGTTATNGAIFPKSLTAANINLNNYGWYRDTWEKLYMYYNVFGS